MNPQMVNTILGIVASRKLVSRTDVGGFKYRLAKFPSAGNYEFTTNWQPLTEGQLLPMDQTTFAEAEIKFPDEILCGPDARDYLFVRFNSMEGTVKINGEVYHGHDWARDRIPLRPEWAGKTLKVEIEAFCRREQRQYFAYCYFGRIDKAIEDYAFNLQLCWNFYNLDNGQGQKDNVHIRTGVINAMRDSMLSFNADAEGAAFREECIKGNKILTQRLAEIDDGDVRGKISFVGHTHIDVAWLWQLKETVRKCGHSFSNVLRLMDEFPDFTFACSQMQLLDYTKQYFPDLYVQLKERIKEGRFETVGTMWVESDCNVISGESLVRQILYGVNFMEKEFGTRNYIAWLPDTFGFQPNIPQIMKKTGTKYFYSNKIHWQGQNRFPYSSFKWKGIDGSEVIASIPLTAGFYNGNPEPNQVRYAKDENLLNGTIDDIILPYGHGDGGGGPTSEMVENARRLADFPGMPRCRMETAQQYFERIEAQESKLPVWYGDLYIETHRGTLTSQGYVKWANRRSEIMYQNAEKLGVTAELLGFKPDWDALHEGWKKILLLQFHDILPGSSINGVYTVDCAENYEIVFNIVKKFTDECAAFLAGKGNSIYVVNTLSWARSGNAEYICDAALAPAGSVVTDETGKALPTTIEPVSDGKVKITFFTGELPALCGKHFHISKGAVPAGGMKVTEKAGEITVENNGYLVTVAADGRVSRLYDKKAEREALSAPANDIKLFMDGPQSEDAWNIYPEYREREVDCGWKVSLSVKENSALRTVIAVKKSSEKTVIDQDIILYPGKARIDFKTHIDWRERHRVMRVYFPCNVSAQFAALEVGFGSYQRPTIASTLFERSRFEVCAHKFIDLSEGEYGVSVLNNCKYGHDVQDNVLGITLLRSTTSPDPTADLGEHDITYSVFPHSGDWRDALTAREGNELNTELLAFTAADRADKNSGVSFLTCDNRNIIVDTIKNAEDGKGFIVRLYECNGNRGKASLSFMRDIAAADETDMLEVSIGKPAVSGSKLDFSFTPYEVKTFRIVL